MEEKKIAAEKARLAELWPVIAEVFAKGGTFPIYPDGVSMLPLLRPGEHGVLLASPPERLKKYDIALYVRDNGAFVLHRVVKARGDTYDMIGDNQVYIERGVRADQIRAVATGRYRDGIFESFDMPALRRYAKRRLFFLPIRSFFVRGKNKLCRIFRKSK